MPDTTTPFHDLDSFLAVPRLTGLALSKDGSRLSVGVSTLSRDRSKWLSSIWSVDPSGRSDAVQLSRSGKSEEPATYLADGSLLFISGRPNPDAESAETSTAAGSSAGADQDPPALWLLPPAGEARQVLAAAFGVEAVSVARVSGHLLISAPAMTAAGSGSDDRTRRKARQDQGVTAILHESYPVRYWDHDLGPAVTHLLVAPGLASDGTIDADSLVDVTPDARGRVGAAAISPDGRLVAYTWRESTDVRRGPVGTVRVVDARSGEIVRTVAAEGFEFEAIGFFDDGTLLCERAVIRTVEVPDSATLVAISPDGDMTDLLPGFDNSPSGCVWRPDGSAVWFTSDFFGHAPVWRLDVASGAVTRLTADGAYSHLVVSDDASVLCALRSSVDQPALPVRLDLDAVEQSPAPLRSPGAIGELPGALSEITCTVEDGSMVRAWLVLPHSASSAEPAPLLLWIHGGPMGSWNAWTWRWNPWTAAARGYAVLLPDPALSTGYGPKMIERGWFGWGGAPYSDLMSITDATIARDDVDETRTAAMGGSFGGYMANWIAGHTSRFKAIVTHASLWQLDAFSGATDNAYYWGQMGGDPVEEPRFVLENSPHLHVDDITTPMLVIHGDKDYRVPIGEGLRLYYDLVRHGVDAKFLYFPTENHWVLTPGNAKIWYETVFAFLAQHVLGEKWERPELL